MVGSRAQLAPFAKQYVDAKFKLLQLMRLWALFYPRAQLFYLSGDVLLVAPVLLGKPQQVGADLRAGRGGLNVCDFCIFLFSHGIFLSFGAKRRHFAAQAAACTSASS